jgi:hypothetical protein
MLILEKKIKIGEMGERMKYMAEKEEEGRWVLFFSRERKEGGKSRRKKISCVLNDQNALSTLFLN